MVKAVRKPHTLKAWAMGPILGCRARQGLEAGVLRFACVPENAACST